MTFSDSRIAKMLTEDFIPVWESVAPVRTVTFNLGEGRSLKGSVSGEIAIYFCNPRGMVYDILPALQSPAATLNAMKEAKQFHDKIQKKDAGEAQAMQTEYHSMIRHFHQERMKKMAAYKYDALLKIGGEILLNPENVDAKLVFPSSAKGETKRDSYINAATDNATRDMRAMVMSKSGMIIPHGKRIFTEQALTVVEPGGRGYYLWQIGRAMHGNYPAGYAPDNEDTSNLFIQSLHTPDQWKKMLFEGIFKQELKGGEVEYDSNSLEAINVFEE